ncbi:hypothetical protein D9M70_574150 [compost metagenome]
MAASIPPRRSSNGVSRTGPRRLWKVIDSALPGCGASSRRSTAGDDSRSAAAGRSAHTTASPACASTCSRRSASGRAVGSHTSTPPKAWLRSICSAAHSMSACPVTWEPLAAPAGGRSQYSWRAGSPAAASPIALGR